MRALQITYVGHATVLVEENGTRILTDPFLRAGIAHIRRVSGEPSPDATRNLDAVVVSHVHGDHLDPASLREIAAPRVFVPSGAEDWGGLRDVGGVEPVVPGDRVAVGGTEILAVPAEHGRTRGPGSPVAADPLGYIMGVSRRVYFAGDTDLFDAMADFAPLDVALVPVAGWGPRVGPGHMDPDRAARALRLLRPRVAIPIHWGTLLAATLWRHRAARLAGPPRAFAAAAARIAPEVEIVILEPGQSVRLD